MNKRSVLVVVGLALIIGLAIGGAAVATTTITAPKDHAQAFIHFPSGPMVVDHEKGFQDVTHPATGVFCFLLPSNIDPKKAIFETNLTDGTSGAYVSWYPGLTSSSCPSSAYQIVDTFFYSPGSGATFADLDFSVVVP